MSWFGLLVVACDHRRRCAGAAGCGCGAGGASGAKPSSPPRKRVDPADPNALAAVPIDALDDLSKAIVVDVDNAVRTSDNELALAVEEFGERADRTVQPRRHQRQDDAGAGVQRPPDPRRRRTRDAAAAARSADPGGRRRREGRPGTGRAARGVRASCAIWSINAPTRLDALTQQMVDLPPVSTRRSRRWPRCTRNSPTPRWRPSPSNVETAKQRLAFADQNITNGRGLVAAPGRPADGAGRRDPGRGVRTRPGPHTARRRRQRGDRHQPRGSRVAVGDRRHPERHQPGRRTAAAAQHAASRRTRPQPGTLRSAAVDDAQKSGTAIRWARSPG